MMCPNGVYGCRTTTDAAEDDVSNDVMDAEKNEVVGRYARYDEVQDHWLAAAYIWRRYLLCKCK